MAYTTLYLVAEIIWLSPMPPAIIQRLTYHTGLRPDVDKLMMASDFKEIELALKKFRTASMFVRRR